MANKYGRVQSFVSNAPFDNIKIGVEFNNAYNAINDAQASASYATSAGYAASTASALVWDYTTTAIATTISSPALDLDTDKGYEIEFIINGNVSTFFRLFMNSDTTAANYRSQYMAATGATVSSAGNNANTVLFTSIDVSTNLFITGSIMRSTAPVLMYTAEAVSGGNRYIVTGTIVYAVNANVTSVSVHGASANGIGINSRFRMWKRS